MELAKLTSHQLRVLQLLATGKTNKQIAVALSVSEKTVEFHLCKLYVKIGAKTRVGAIVWGVQHGLAV